MLDASQIQAGALAIILEPTAVDEVVAPAVDELGSRPGEVTIDISAGIPLVVADPVLLQRVMVNLATNAIRFASLATACRPHRGAAFRAPACRVGR